MFPLGSNGLSGWAFFVGAFLVYANTLTHSYALDDYLIIVNNELVQAGWSKIGELLTSPFAWGAGFNDGLYRPLTLLTFASEIAVFGPSQPLPSHLINVSLFAVLCALLFRLVRQWWPEFPKLWLGIAIGLFTFHPIHTEVVANIKSRDELLGFLFVVSSALAAYRFFTGQNISWAIMATFSLLLALLSKESTIVFVLLLPLAYSLLLGKTFRKQIPILLGYATVSVLFLGLRHMALEVWHPVVNYATAYNELSNSLEPTTGLTRFGMSSLLVVKYLWKCLFPLHLGYEYSYNQIPVRAWTDPFVLSSIAMNACLMMLMLRGLMQRKLYGFALMFFYASIALFSNLFFIIGVTFAERFAFVPSFAVCVILAYVLQEWAKKGANSRSWALGCAILILVLFAVRTMVRNPIWKDNQHLFIQGVQQVPNSAKAHYNAATEYSALSRATGGSEQASLTNKAIAHFQMAIGLFPDYPDAQNNLANIYLEAENYETALSLLNQVLAQYPRHRKGRYNRAIALYEIENYEEAARDFETYLSFTTYNLSNQAQAHYFLGMSLGFLGQFDRSIQVFSKAVRLNPNYWEAHLALGKAYGVRGNFEASIQHLEQVLRIVPTEVESKLNLAISYMNLAEFQKAADLLQPIVQAQPDHLQARTLWQDAQARLAAGH